MTRVVNIKYNKNYDVYCGRAGHGMDGYFGNPHTLGFCKMCNTFHDRDSCLAAYKDYFYSRLKSDIVFKHRIEELRGKVLSCFCRPEKCHCDIIAEYLDKYDQTNSN